MNIEKALEIIHKSSPKLTFCERFNDASSIWNFAPHSHDCIELMYFINGNGKIEVLGESLNVSLHDTVIYPAGWIHQDGFSSDLQREIICLWVEIPELVIDRAIHLYGQNSGIGNVFKMIFSEAKEKRADEYELEYLLKYLFTLVFRESDVSHKNPHFEERIVNYIQEHYPEKILIKDLAKTEHVSESYLSRKFKAHTGMTIVSYINQCRIEEAQFLLVSTDLTVNEIAYRIGFETPKYFFRVFKEIIGSSPGEFRKKYKIRSSE